MKVILSLTIIFLSLFQITNAQNVGISANGSLAKPSAGLDIDFQDKGLLIPRVSLTSTTDILTVPNPEPSLLIYNNNSSMTGGGIGFWFWDGAIWKQLSTGQAGGAGWLPTGNAGLTAANFLGTTDNIPLSFYTNNAERLRINETGFVGIGTSNPKKKLHVLSDDSGTPSMVALDNVNTTNGSGISLSFRGTTTGAGAESLFEFACIRAVYLDHNHATSSSALGFFTVLNKSIKQRMRINPNGYVGINTTEQKSFLDVYGSIGTAIDLVTKSTTLTELHHTLIVTNATSVLTLPVASTVARRTYRIINQTGSPVSIDSYLDFAGTFLTAIPGNSKIEIQSNGTNWYRVD